MKGVHRRYCRADGAEALAFLYLLKDLRVKSKSLVGLIQDKLED